MLSKEQIERLDRGESIDDTLLIHLDKDRLLKLPYNQIQFYKKKFGKDITDIEKFEMDVVAKILFVAMRQEDPEITLEKTEELISQKPLGYSLYKAERIIELTFGAEEPENNDSEEKNLKAPEISE